MYTSSLQISDEYIVCFDGLGVCTIQFMLNKKLVALLAAAGLTRDQSQNLDLSQIPQSQFRSLVVVPSAVPFFLIKATIRPKTRAQRETTFLLLRFTVL